MFENDLAELDAADTLAAAEDNEHALITAETRRLHIAAHSADLHPGGRRPTKPYARHRTPHPAGRGRHPHHRRLRTRRTGLCAAHIGRGSRKADRRRLRPAAPTADDLDSRTSGTDAGLPDQPHCHRHPTKDQAGFVDAHLAPSLATVSWNRLPTLLEAAIYEADPVGAEQRAALAAQQRFVRLGRNSEHGLKLIIAWATAGDAIWFQATIDRIADILGRQDDEDPLDVRRSKAIGILAQPAQALQLLCQHQDDDWDGLPEPTDPAQQPDQQSDTEPAADPAGESAQSSLQLIPPPFHPGKAQPRAVNYVHLSEEALTASTAIAHVENVAPVLLNQLYMLLGDHCSISLKPVINLPAGHTPVDGYEIPASLREQILLRDPADVFPYAAAVSRSIYIDHTIPYLNPNKGGPPGQTRLGKLGPHIRYPHRIKTHGGWQVRQPEPGTWLWRSPHHRIYLVNASGTHPLGNTEFAQAIWRAARRLLYLVRFGAGAITLPRSRRLLRVRYHDDHLVSARSLASVLRSGLPS